MAYHEQHERKCPTCGERISATAPKCFNCGEFVNDDDDEEEEEEAGAPGRSWVLAAGFVGALLGVGLLVYFGFVRRSGSEADGMRNAEQLHRMMGQQAGRSSLNQSSPITLADVEPHLQVGMPFRDLLQLVSQKNSGPMTSTVIGTVPLSGAEGEADDTKPGPQAYIIYLKDSNLVVHTDENENVVSWRSEPIP